MSSVTKRNKTRIAKQFSRAASTYDSAADVQLDIAFDALYLLPKQAEIGLDIGCGTGRISRLLQTKCDRILAMDLAFGMLAYAKQFTLPDESSIQWLQGDAEHLPIQDNSVDMVFSSMALQWCDNQQSIMAEIQRVLKPKGQAVLAIMCEGSFTELNNTWQHVDSHRHVNQFASAESWVNVATQQGLNVTATQKSYTTWHNNIRQLLSSIKSIGANVLLEPQLLEPSNIEHNSTNHFNRHTMQLLERHYQQLYSKNDGKNSQLPLTYKVCFIQCSQV